MAGLVFSRPSSRLPDSLAAEQRWGIVKLSVESAVAGLAGGRSPVAHLSLYEIVTEHLGVPAATVQWSLYPQYAAANEGLGHEWDGTPDPLKRMCDALDEGKDVAVEAATGTQKTFTAAAVSLAYMAKWSPGAQVITLAPKQEQLAINLWKEVDKLWPAFKKMFPAARMGSLYIEIVRGSNSKGYMAGYAAAVRAGETSATRAQGIHAPRQLFVFEETPGIPPAIMTAVENTLSQHNRRLALGNPDSVLDPLHKLAEEKGVEAIRISGLDHPNVVCGEEMIPGAIDPVVIAKRRHKYGERSPFFLSRCRGISPEDPSDAVIRVSWVRRAVLRGQELLLKAQQQAALENRAPIRAMGVDVANSDGGDLGAIAYFEENVCTSFSSFPCPDCNLLGLEVVAQARRRGIEPKRIGVDGVGVGAGTVNRCREAGLRVQSIISGGSPSIDWKHEEEFFDLRAQMWWAARLDFQNDDIGIVFREGVDDREQLDMLIADLCTPKWNDNGRVIRVEEKDDIRIRLGRSPDCGDAFIYGNWIRRIRGIKSAQGRLI